MERHLLFGVRKASVDATATAIGSAVECSFEDRDSSYLGPYKFAVVGSSEIKVVSQIDPDGEPLEEDFEDFATLVYVDSDGDAVSLEGISVANEPLEQLRAE